jgi:branched-chain amino acid transport system ATP-binding protein
MNLVEVDDLVAGYGRVRVVHRLALSVAEGEVVSLLGPNGAGKTTTLLTLSGHLPALGGTVRILDQATGRGRAHRLARRGVGYVPQDRAIFSHLRAVDHLRLAGHGDRQAIDRVLDVIPEMAGWLDRRAGLLSGGEQQLLAFGRAIASRPRLLLLDEPSTGLAPAITSRLFAWIRGQATDHGLGVLLVDQHVTLTLAHSDRVLILQSGEVVASGSSTDVAADPSLIKIAYLGLT